MSLDFKEDHSDNSDGLLFSKKLKNIIQICSDLKENGDLCFINDCRNMEKLNLQLGKIIERLNHGK